MNPIVRQGWVGLATVALLGVLNLPNPYSGDQALFAIGARMMNEGAVYYREIWDIKQPGIFLFYEAGGRLFGFGPVGVHLFELLYMLVFASVLLLALRPYFARRWALALVPVAAVGAYYLLARGNSQTLIEALAGFPLFVSMWASMQAVRRDGHENRWMFVAGAAAGLAAVLKLLLLVVAAWFLLTAVVQMRRRHAVSPGRLATTTATFVAGILTILAPFVAYYAWIGLGRVLYRTTFLYPPRIARLPGIHTADLLEALVRRAVLSYSGLALLAFALVVVMARARRLDMLTANLLGWLGLGTLVILAQRWSPYQTQLLLVPLGVLAARALDELEPPPPERRVLALSGVAAVAISLLPPLAWQAAKAGDLVRHRFALSSSDRDGLWREDPEYAAIAEEVDALGPLPGPLDPIYVLGHPLYYVLLDRTQAISLNGWSPEQWLGDQWDDLVDQLDQARPKFLFVDRAAAALLEGQPAAARLIGDLYQPVHRSRSSSVLAGTWYRLADGS